MKKWVSLCSSILFSTLLLAQTKNLPGLSLLKKEEIKKDLYTLADARFRGRSAGTLDELKASAWLGEEFRKIGLKPAGDHGTYFQFFTIWRNVLSPSSSIQLNGTPQAMWKDAMVMQPATVQLDDTIVYLGDAAAMDTASLDVKGKVVALVANKKGINLDVSLPKLRYPGYNYVRYGMPLVRRGAKAILFIADEQMESGWDDAVSNYILGRYDIPGGPNENITATVPVIWLRSGAQQQLQNGTGQMKAQLSTIKYPFP
ncbi:MAG: peptidase M28, partial [Bacteroidota bacterium]|nr:peptidase M28 [Bacteroidota bacterium]